jgi:hypothetical protein
METEQILSFISPALIILVAAVYCLGIFLKSSQVKDKYIPLILLVSSIVLTIAYMALIQGVGFNPTVIIDGLIQGILIASVAVYGNQVLKQVKKDE